MSPDPIAAISRPSLMLLGSEPWRAAFEFLSLKLAPRTPGARGDGHPVIIFPGLASDGTAVAPLKDYCNALGYAASDWGLGYNTGPKGDVDGWLQGLADHVRARIDGQAKPATLIGWSLGGLYARELGKLLAPCVRQVISIGTPFNADSDHTNVGWLFRALNGSKVAIDPALSRRLRTPPPVPTTSIYSRSDGVVAWQTCLHDGRHAMTENVEVAGSHIGMVWNRAVMGVIADRLAQRPGRWRRYEPRENLS